MLSGRRAFQNKFRRRTRGTNDPAVELSERGAPSKSSDLNRARKYAMDILARRDHSELEIRRKMKDWYELPIVEQVIDEMKGRKWIPRSVEEEQQLAERFARTLNRRKKSQLWINQKLKSIGLPAVQGDEQIEMEKALELAQKRLARKADLQEALPGAVRALKSRGYSSTVIQKVIAAVKRQWNEERE